MSLQELERRNIYNVIEEHYKKNFKLLVNKLSRYFGSKHSAEDIVQEAYYNALRYWHTYDNKQPFDNWFRTIVNNAIRFHYKQEMLHGMLDDSGLLKEEMEERMLKPFFQRIELKELLKKIEEQTDRIKRILKLYLLEGYTSLEVETIVPENANNIRKIVQRFRDEIKLI